MPDLRSLCGDEAEARRRREGQRRADLSVDGQHVEVKGLSTLNPDTVENKIKHAFTQVDADNAKYPKETHISGKVILLSKHDHVVSEGTIYEKMYAGYLSAKNKGYVTGEVELWINGNVYKFR